MCGAKVWWGVVVMLPLVLVSGNHALFRYTALIVFTNQDTLRILSSRRGLWRLYFRGTIDEVVGHY